MGRGGLGKHKMSLYITKPPEQILKKMVAVGGGSGKIRPKNASDLDESWSKRIR